MKVEELLEAKEKPADDLSVDPGTRVKRIIKSILGDSKPKFQLVQTVSQPKKSGDAIVNIEVGNPYRRMDLSKMVDDDEDETTKAIRDKIAARTKTDKLPDQKREFMVTLFKRVKAELSGLKEVGYLANATPRKYVYVAADEFDPEKLIKNWSGDIRFKFAFSADVHSLKFDVEKESKLVAAELADLIRKDPEFEGMKVNINYSSTGVELLVPTEFVKSFAKNETNRAKAEAEKKPWSSVDDNLTRDASTEYREKFWPKHKKKIKSLFAQIKTPLRLMLSGGSYNMAISFGKPRASDLDK